MDWGVEGDRMRFLYLSTIPFIVQRANNFQIPETIFVFCLHLVYSKQTKLKCNRLLYLFSALFELYPFHSGLIFIGHIQWKGHYEWYRGEKVDRIADEKKRNGRLNSPAQEQEKSSFYRCESDETAHVNGFGRKHWWKWSKVVICALHCHKWISPAVWKGQQGKRRFHLCLHEANSICFFHRCDSDRNTMKGGIILGETF